MRNCSDSACSVRSFVIIYKHFREWCMSCPCLRKVLGYSSTLTLRQIRLCGLVSLQACVALQAVQTLQATLPAAQAYKLISNYYQSFYLQPSLRRLHSRTLDCQAPKMGKLK